MYQNNYGYQQPVNPVVPQAPQYPYAANDPEVDRYVDAAFSKSLAATIMCSFPVASIIAIVFGNTGLNLIETAKYLAAQRGVKPSGKIIAANVLGKIGKIAGIVMTIIWAFYFLLIFALIANFN